MVLINSIFVFLIANLLTLISCDSYCGNYNCYQLLGVQRLADQNTIKKAFREMAKKYHPDKNKQEDTTQFFQIINKAYEILTNEKSRFKYDLHLQNPEESDFYHEYRYYSQKYIQNPQIHPAIVVSVLLSLASLLQYVMRKQMYEKAIEQITQGHDFKTKVNQRCGKNKRIKDQIRQQMIKQIQIEGGYSKPLLKDMLICKIVLFPYNLYMFLHKKIRWFYRYTIKKYAYTKQQEEELTFKALGLTQSRWQGVDQKERTLLLTKKLWIKQNLAAYHQEARQKWLEQLKTEKPHQYKMVMKHLNKNQ